MRRDVGMHTDEIGSSRPAVTVIAAVGINSFVITHSIIVTAIVTFSALVAELSRKKRPRRLGKHRRES